MMPRDMPAAEYNALDRRHALALETLARWQFTAEPGVSYVIVGFVGQPSAFDADTDIPTHTIPRLLFEP